MAIKIHEFFDRYLRQTTNLFVTLQIVAALLGGAAAWVAWQTLGFGAVQSFVAGLLAVIIANIIVAAITLRIISDPLRIMSRAVAHVSNDPVVTEPPDVSAPRYEKSGLKAMVQTIYELAVATSSKNDGDGPSVPADFFKHLTDNLSCGIVTMDPTGKIIYSNPAAPVRQTAENASELSLIFEQNDTFAKWLADAQANKVRDDHTWERVADKVPGEKDRRIFDIAAHYQKDDPGGVEVTLVAFDRTSTYGPDQDDMDFIALAAHELRGPITVIRGYLDVLNQEVGPALNEDQQVLLDRLQVSAERLSGYINNILNVSRYDRDQFSMHMQEESILELFKSLIPDLALRAKTQRRKLTFAIPQDLPTIAADRTSISEVIINLIDNAIKYSHEGGEITIGASLKENAVEVTVTDNGIGMPASVMGNLFNKFYRSHRSRQSVGGTGLGLFICKAIVEGHGGQIWVRSQEGKGSTFGFSLPIYSAVAQKLADGDNKDIVQRNEGWIKNHAMYRR